MNELSQNSPSNYFDLNSLNELRRDATSADGDEKGALKKAAQHFEAIFMNMLVQSMRKANAAFESDGPFNSESTKFYQDMHDQQLTMELSQNGSLGLADLIVEQLSPDYNKTMPSSLIRNDGNFNTAPDLSAPVSKPPVTQLSGNELPVWVIDKFKEYENQRTTQIEKSVEESTMTFNNADEFIDTVWSFATTAAKKLNLNPAVMVAQAALETGWGQHIISQSNGQSSFNLFNIKADPAWQGSKVNKQTLEFEQGVAVKKNAAFRAYENIEESFNDFVNFLTSGERYQGTLKKSNDPEQFLHSLQKAGYATDPNYANKILSILKSERFTQGLNRAVDNINR